MIDRDSLKKWSALKGIVVSIEKEIGLERCSDAEKLVIEAFAHETKVEGDYIKSKKVRIGPFCSFLTVPTYHRALKYWRDLGILKPAEHRKTSLYQLDLPPQ